MNKISYKKIIKAVIIVILVFLLSLFLMIDDTFSATRGVDDSMYLDSREYISVNGVELFVSIRAEKENAPILLYLHGGPGDAALPLVLKYKGID